MGKNHEHNISLFGGKSMRLRNDVVLWSEKSYNNTLAPVA